jgi:hypothetical protein
LARPAFASAVVDALFIEARRSFCRGFFHPPVFPFFLRPGPPPYGRPRVPFAMAPARAARPSVAPWTAHTRQYWSSSVLLCDQLFDGRPAMSAKVVQLTQGRKQRNATSSKGRQGMKPIGSASPSPRPRSRGSSPRSNRTDMATGIGSSVC